MPVVHKTRHSENTLQCKQFIVCICSKYTIVLSRSVLSIRFKNIEKCLEDKGQIWSIIKYVKHLQEKRNAFYKDGMSLRLPRVHHWKQVIHFHYR